METPNYQTLLFISFCSLIIFNPALANLDGSIAVNTKLGLGLPVLPIQVNVNPAINNICKSTDYVDVCLSSITPFLNGKTDLISVVGMEINAAIKHTKLAVSVATNIATIPNTPAPLKSAAEDCKSSYNDALDNYQKSLEALAGRDIGTMNSMLSASITAFSDCEDRLEGQSSPLSSFDNTGRMVTSNCLAIVSLIK